MDDELTSLKSGLKRYLETYGLASRKNLSEFLGMTKKMVYENIELKNLGMSMYKFIGIRDGGCKDE